MTIRSQVATTDAFVALLLRVTPIFARSVDKAGHRVKIDHHDPHGVEPLWKMEENPSSDEL